MHNGVLTGIDRCRHPLDRAALACGINAFNSGNKGNPARPFTGKVQNVADRRTPYRTISEIMYTVGQCEFANLRFVVQKPPSPRR